MLHKRLQTVKSEIFELEQMDPAALKQELQEMLDYCRDIAHASDQIHSSELKISRNESMKDAGFASQYHENNEWVKNELNEQLSSGFRITLKNDLVLELDSARLQELVSIFDAFGQDTNLTTKIQSVLDFILHKSASHTINGFKITFTHGIANAVQKMEQYVDFISLLSTLTDATVFYPSFAQQLVQTLDIPTTDLAHFQTTYARLLDLEMHLINQQLATTAVIHDFFDRLDQIVYEKQALDYFTRVSQHLRSFNPDQQWIQIDGFPECAVHQDIVYFVQDLLNAPDLGFKQQQRFRLLQVFQSRIQTLVQLQTTKIQPMTLKDASVHHNDCMYESQHHIIRDHYKEIPSLSMNNVQESTAVLACFTKITQHLVHLKQDLSLLPPHISMILFGAVVDSLCSLVNHSLEQLRDIGADESKNIHDAIQQLIPPDLSTDLEHYCAANRHRTLLYCCILVSNLKQIMEMYSSRQLGLIQTHLLKRLIKALFSESPLRSQSLDQIH
ncbi:hypothetical protein EDD86DRAFT_244164 [Gorgonomyces haynaldii]|nr:hypothetical protein EDD86DRAFT_244164 [Gorgonomyces haynaldii]